jgi:alkylation response protein AidB-like acyl-CoA dehydrogenase
MAFPLSHIPTHRDRLAALPLLSRLGAGLSFVTLGVATHAIDLLIELAALKQPFGTRQALRDRADVQIAVARARALVESARAYVSCTWQEAECAVLDGGAPTTDTLVRLRLSYVAATENAATATDLAYRAAGSSALFEDQGLERCWRDAHAVTQHVAVSSRHLERIGQVMLGLAPGPGLL